MRGALRHIAMLAASAIAATGLSACGGSAGEVVANIQGVGAISKGVLEHWIPIEAKVLYSVVPTRPVPTGVVPDPPTYSNCVAYLASIDPKPKPTVAQLRSACAQQYQRVKIETLNVLISWEWTIGAGAAAGIKLTDAEVKQRLETVRKNDLSYVSFPKYLEYSGQSMGDMLFRSRVQLFEVKLGELAKTVEASLPKGLTLQQQEALLKKIAPNIPTQQQWVQRTSCKAGYVTSSCKQYRGPEAPGLPN